MSYNGSALSPGDVVCLDAGSYTRLHFHSFTGAAGNPIIICNVNGLAHMDDTGDTVDLDDCQHIRFTGTGDDELDYGIKLIRRLRVRDHSHNVEIDHVEMCNDDVAISIVNNEDRTDFQYFEIHHNYIHDIRDEGMYIGNAGKANRIKNVDIYSNVLKTVGEGIQVGWTEGCKIHDNYIVDVNTASAGDPCYAAISICEDCDSTIYNNEIRDSDRRGISIQDGKHDIYNNLIVNTGHGPRVAPAIKNFSDCVRMFNNTIITSASYGIDCSASETHNLAFNNVILDTVSASIDKGGSPDANFYNNHTKEDGYTLSNYGFVDVDNGDYHLADGCVGICAGASSDIEKFDLDGQLRPQGSAPDVGCYEYVTEEVIIVPVPLPIDSVQHEIARLWGETQQLQTEITENRDMVLAHTQQLTEITENQDMVLARTQQLQTEITENRDMVLAHIGKVSVTSMFLSLPGLRAFWPMSLVDQSGNAYDLSGQGRILTYNGNPTYNFRDLAPHLALDGSRDYLSSAREAGLDLLGTEDYVASKARGFTIGGWFYPSDLSTAYQGVITKGDNTVNNDNWHIWNHAGKLLVQVHNGGDTYAAEQAIPAANTWYFWVLRFVPSTSVDCYQNDAKVSNTSGIPASANNSTAPLNIGALNGGAARAFFKGRVSMCFLCATALSDETISALFQGSRQLFGV